ncbi:MAG: M23 family metallopeptidase, partial [Candidatus Rokuibacteriota bacterium]
MKYRTRRKVERVRRAAAVVGASFAIGALTASGLLWRHQQIEIRPADPPAEIDARTAAPASVGTTGVISDTAAVAALRARDLAFPVGGIGRGGLHDSFFDTRDGRTHDAIDIMAPRHTSVVAVDEGTIAKLFFSDGGGGITIYQFDPSKAFSYYYAHLDRYAEGLREGQRVRRGDLLGYVGSTGNASAAAPHLHFAIFRLTPERQWWRGDPLNPYAVFKR